MFGLGYIGYMTFIVTLLREQGLPSALVSGFYVVLGLGVVASSWLWAGMLQRHQGGRPLATLNGLLVLTTVLPVLSAHPLAAFVSGALFGSVFLSVVANTFDVELVPSVAGVTLSDLTPGVCQPLPKPASWLLMLAGVAGLLPRVRRKRAAGDRTALIGPGRP